MEKQHQVHRFVLVGLACVISMALATAANADTIYMKNGRTIQSSHVRVEGDRVIFLQYGGEVTLPLSAVDRIVEDTNVEPEATPAPAEPVDLNDPNAVSGGNPNAPSGGAPAGDPGADPGADPDASGDVPPEQTRDYWQERVGANQAERAEVELQIEDLKRTERAFLFSHRSTADVRVQIEAAEARLVELDQELSDLQAEARRLQIPAGWLRLDSSGGGGSSGSGGSGSGG